MANTIWKEEAKATPCNLWIVVHQGGVMMTDKKGNRWIAGPKRTTFIAIFYTKKAAQKAAKRAIAQRKDLYGWVRVERCAGVRKKED